MMQPDTTSGAVANPYSSAPSSAATITSRPVFSWPSTWTTMRSRRPFMSRVCWVSARPSSQGMPACLPISGAHINPVVSVVDAAFGGLSWWDAAAYLPTQVAGCTLGAIVANVRFAVSAVSVSTKHRASGPHFLSEVVATLGLLLVIFALARTGRSRSAPAALGAYIGAAYFFTSSTSFANPAITVGRMFSNTFAGVAPSSAPTFIAAQIVGAALAVVVIKVLYPTLTPAEAADIIVPHAEATSTNGTVVPANTALAKEAP